MNIEELLNKYFEGETTCEEERELRRYFCQDIVPEYLQMYRPLFGYLAQENKMQQRMQQTASTQQKSRTTRQRILYACSGLAAAVLLLISIAGIHRHLRNSPDSYVIIDGKQYADPALARQQAIAAFQSVSISEDDVFSTLFEE